MKPTHELEAPRSASSQETSAREGNFEAELTCLLNKYSKENGSNTPDFILTQYLVGCLHTWNTVVQKREIWYKTADQVKNHPSQFAAT